MWVVVALCTLIALTALVLSVPVDLGLRVEVHARPFVHVRVEWLFGRVTRTLRTGVGARKVARARAVRKKKPSARPKREGKGVTAGAAGRLVWDLIRTPGLLRNAVRMVVRLLRCIKVRLLRVDFRVDLDDPASTALVVGGASQVAMMANMWSPYSFRLMPAFDGEALLDGEAEVAVRMHPICTVPPVLAFVFAPSTLRAIVRVIRWRMRKGD